MKKNDELVWAALSDATRRAILDAIREQPRTTGALAALFPTSRFAVMKHLKVLVDAGLVVVRRQGRERWNHVNAAPLQRIHQRWVSNYAAQWAGGLRRLKHEMERGDRMETAGITRIELEMSMRAPGERVWKALTEQTALWWREDFYAGSATTAMRLEPVVGGRLYEDGGEGRGVLWYTVIAIDPPHSLDLSGVLSAAFGGPALSTLRLELVARGDETLLKLSDSILGTLTDADEKSAGWQTLFGEALKGFVESHDSPR